MKMDTSWQKVSKWYGDKVGSEGHFYHQTVILPNLLRLMDLKPTDSVLDLACGSGILAKYIPEDIAYTGLDLSPNLLDLAKNGAKSKQKFILADVTKPFPLKDGEKFSHICVILAWQNIDKTEELIRIAKKYLSPAGKIYVVLNHPCFRVMGKSEWGWDPEGKTQYRRIDGYLSRFKKRIIAHPGAKESVATWSFHTSLQDISKIFFQNKMSIEKIEEWISPKKSEGGRAEAEDVARKEIPLFMSIIAK